VNAQHREARGISICPGYRQSHRREIPVPANRNSTDWLARTQVCSMSHVPTELSRDDKLQDITRLSG